jgi:hypothetical protein
MKQRADCLEAMRWTLKMVGFVLAAAWAMIGEHRAFSMLAYVWRRTRDAETGASAASPGSISGLASQGYAFAMRWYLARKQRLSRVRSALFVRIG